MGSLTAHPVILDAGGLIALERGNRRVLALCKVAVTDGGGVVVPAGALAQVWRSGGRQVAVARVVEAAGTVVEPLDLTLAKLAGVLCGRAGTSDVVDASVVLTARRHNGLVVTSDLGDLGQLDPALQMIPC